MKNHWESIHSTKAPSQLSWYQLHSSLSLEFIKRTNVSKSSQIIDVGGGTSTLVDDLLAEGYAHLTVLDISSGALQIAQHRLEGLAAQVDWIEADITHVVLPNQAYDVWHDRAVFHFLTQPDDRQKYLLALRRSLRSGGHVILSTFGLDGPSKCSGIEVVRYSAESLINEFGVGFELLYTAKETHRYSIGFRAAIHLLSSSQSVMTQVSFPFLRLSRRWITKEARNARNRMSRFIASSPPLAEGDSVKLHQRILRTQPKVRRCSGEHDLSRRQSHSCDRTITFITSSKR